MDFVHGAVLLRKLKTVLACFLVGFHSVAFFSTTKRMCGFDFEWIGNETVPSCHLFATPSAQEPRSVQTGHLPPSSRVAWLEDHNDPQLWCLGIRSSSLFSPHPELVQQGRVGASLGLHGFQD